MRRSRHVSQGKGASLRLRTVMNPASVVQHLQHPQPPLEWPWQWQPTLELHPDRLSQERRLLKPCWRLWETRKLRTCWYLTVSIVLLMLNNDSRSISNTIFYAFWTKDWLSPFITTVFSAFWTQFLKLVVWSAIIYSNEGLQLKRKFVFFQNLREHGTYYNTISHMRSIFRTPSSRSM